MADITLGHITNSFGISIINNNMDIIQAAVNNGLLNLSGGNNTMLQQLDMNSNKIINILVDENDPTSIITMAQLQEAYDYVDDKIKKGQILVSAKYALDSPRVCAVKDGQAYYPDLTNKEDVCNIMGVTQQAVPTGEATWLVNNFSFQDIGWVWTPGRVYCSLNDGRFTQVAPTSGAVVEVGRAPNTITVHVNLSPAILRET